MQCPPCRECEYGDCDHCLAVILGDRRIIDNPREHCRCYRNKHPMRQNIHKTKFMCWFL